MPTESDAAGAESEVPAGEPGAHPALGTAGSAALAAAGEAVAFFAGAPIAGVADGAIGLGEAVSDREAKLEEAITGRHESATPAIDTPTRTRSPLLWVALAVIVIAALIWAFRV